MPTTQPRSGVVKWTPKSVFSVGAVRRVQVAPPSVVTRSVPNSPEMNPCCASGKEMS
jgi:hypothetical protein